MSRKPKAPALTDAKKFYKLLLYEASGGNLGSKPEVNDIVSNATFGEKKALLAEIIKLAMIEQKSIEDQPEESGLDMIRKQINGGRTDSGRGNFGGAAESGSDDSADGDAASLDPQP